MKTQQYYGINTAIGSVAHVLQDGSDHSATTIRCALNDDLDAASKSGYRVRFDYNQPRAVAAVKRLLRK